MNLKGISPEQGPEISIPFRFYFLAHLNIITILIILILKYISGFSVFFDVNHHSTLVLFHSFSIGFILFIILGSLFQMFPVVIGVVIQNSKKISILLLFLLYFIYIFFYIYFNYFKFINLFILLNFILLVILFIFFIHPMIKIINGDNTGFLFFFISLLVGIVTILFYFINAYFPFFDLELSSVRRIHGIIMLISIQQLIVSVSFYVIPMFYVTPSFPYQFRLLLLFGYFILILLLFLFQNKILLYIYSLLNSIYIFYSLNILRKRSRKISDLSQIYFISGLILLLIVSIFALFDSLREKYLVELFIIQIGFIVAFIYGMLYKIVPFLCWFHLQTIKNRKIFEFINQKRDTQKILSLNFFMSDFILKKLENIHYMFFIVSVLALVLIKKYLLTILFLLLIFFLIFFIQMIYAIYRYYKVLRSLNHLF